MGYRARRNSTDQVPARAISEGLLPRFGGIDSSDGGATHRYSLSADVQRSHGRHLTRATAYLVRYTLNLFSNFTFFLDDPINGDQFEQADGRWVAGFRASQRRLGRWQGRNAESNFGVQLRHDDIGVLGLFRTRARERLSATRKDSVAQTSASVYAQNELQWSEWLRTTVGLRGDFYRFNVHADNPLNSGTETTGLFSPKAGVAFGPWHRTEIYGNSGFGFHSNDARGSTITVDPVTREPVQRVTPLVRAKGAEAGVRTLIVPRLQSTLAVWRLDLDSELLFIGDAGTTEVSRPSRRYGVEWANYYRPRRWLTLDADLAFSVARFTDADPAGDRIPGSVERVVSMGAAVDALSRWSAGVRLRHLGPRALVENQSVRSRSSSLLNAQIGYDASRRLRLTIDVFNLLNAQESDIDYYYRSRLPGEPFEGVAGVHTHPAQPRTARVGVLLKF
jgi:outer membrane receptor protein involved in Fe transport